ncbi:MULTISPECIES: MetQ/NlpA family ABC transporter substrate-binding protein [Corynebacterium]|uniref:MetQ/NlpA family ABC transporter substrate-binding protein n=1 Tax=Corynebacterium TaxID=1716 RepID=UPI00124F66EC|nr:MULTISPECIES: MetQ/NlpA family ABC transporter substrate-binding protein [Corynebacterium]
MKRFTRTTAALATVALSATALVACGSDDSSTIKLGSTDSTLKQFAAWEDAANENDIDLEVVNFSDFNTPNKALAEGEIDANSFQHLKFLAEHNVGSGDDLLPIGSTYIVPLALYWKDHDSLDGIEGQEIVIPNDPSNQGRAINVLVQADLITLKNDVNNPTPADIDKDKSKVKVQPVDAAQTPTGWGEGKPAIINNSFLDRAGIDPKSSIFADDPNSELAEPYINVVVVRAEDKDNEQLKKLAEIWHTQAVVDADQEDTAGTSVAVDRPADELQEILHRLEDEIRKG